jgi:hypothetical protein
VIAINVDYLQKSIHVDLNLIVVHIFWAVPTFCPLVGLGTSLLLTYFELTYISDSGMNEICLFHELYPSVLASYEFRGVEKISL